MGIFHQRFHLFCIRHDAGGRDGVTEEICVRGAEGGLCRGKLEVVLSHTQEEALHVRDLKGGVGIEDNHVVEVSSDAVESLDDLVDDLDEPPWSSADPLRHHQPLEEAHGCAESSERCVVLCTVIW